MPTAERIMPLTGSVRWLQFARVSSRIRIAQTKTPADNRGQGLVRENSRLFLFGGRTHLLRSCGVLCRIGLVRGCFGLTNLHLETHVGQHRTQR